MSPYRGSSVLVLIALHIYCLVSSDGLNVSVSESANKLRDIPTLSSVAAAEAAADVAEVDEVNSPAFKPAVESIFSLNLLSSFPENLEISEYCADLLRTFGQRYVAHVNCSVSSARPVKICQNCFSTYGSLVDIYKNISSDQMGPGNVSCSRSLLRSDRLMVVFVLYSSMNDLWANANCDKCITKGSQSLTNDTLYFMATLNQTLTCFEKYQQGNHTELCKNCKNLYRDVNLLYGRMEQNQTMCIDIEDSMNATRGLWSKTFNCSFPREETVPVIAVSSFMLFLPIIFYLSSFLHSEQKKRKLIHPKRAKSYTSLMNIQDRLS